MATELLSPGIQDYEKKGAISRIRVGSNGIGYMIGVGEWGEIAKPITCISFPDFEKKIGGYLNGYYLAKCARNFFDAGGVQLVVVRTAHYTAGTLDAIKANKMIQGYNEGDEDRTKVDTLKFKATAEGIKGNKINVTNQKVATTTNGALTVGAKTSAVLTSVTGFKIGDVVDISDGTHYVRVIITHINTGTKTIYFKSVTLATEIATLADVKTSSTHQARTTLVADLTSNATSIELTSVAGLKIGSLVTVVDKQSGSPNYVIFKITDISNKVVSFADIGTVTTIAVANGEVVSQEFDISIYYNQEFQKKYTYLSMVNENETDYIENKISNDFWVTVADQNSAEGDIGDIPEVFRLVYLTSGDDGLTGLAEADFSGDEGTKTGLYAFDSEPRRYAQIGCPDFRSAAFHENLDNYATARLLWAVFDFDFDKTYEEAVTYVEETSMLNTNMGEINYPNVKWKNPLTGVIQVIPSCGAIMGNNAKVWTAIGKGPWIASSGTEDGVIDGVEGFENDSTEDNKVRDVLSPARINSLYRYAPWGNVKYDILTLEVSGDFPQIPERVTFLYCRHAIVNGTPWIVFKNNDVSNRERLYKTIRKFLLGVWKPAGGGTGGLKGLTESEAFEIDVSEKNVNTAEVQEAGNYKARIGLATKKAGRFVYFEFAKKLS